jgi:hypothetical protein
MLQFYLKTVKLEEKCDLFTKTNADINTVRNHIIVRRAKKLRMASLIILHTNYGKS